MKVLLLGSGGREHALAWRLAQSPTLEELHAAPGNPGIATLGDCHPVRAEDVEAVLELARALGVDLVVVGPEAPLVVGVADELRHGGISVFTITDGARTIALPVAQDFKRVGEADTGPNTGGMGAYAPVAGIDAEEIVDSVHRPVLEELARRGSPFVGVLYAGLMMTDDGPRVLEFNCRFGDPETQALVPLLDDDLLGALAAAAQGDLREKNPHASDQAAVTVVLAAAGYPDEGDTGSPIEGIADAERHGALVFHAGTAIRGGRLVTNGGRILSVTATGHTVPEAREAAYAAVDRIDFPGARYRRDVAAEQGQR